MIRVAFTLIGGRTWTGGHNYLLNLLQSLSAHESSTISLVLFVPTDFNTRIDDFKSIEGLEIVPHNLFNNNNYSAQLLQAIFFGYIKELDDLFIQHRIHVVFQAAQFYGWRSRIPAIAWIPDFQHRFLPHLFPKYSLLKREIGFRAQTRFNRNIMLSSNDAQNSCELFYPSTKGKTHVVHFALPTNNMTDFSMARSIADNYGLPENFFFLPNQFWRHKNHFLVIEALSLLQSHGIEVIVAASGKQLDPRAPDYFNYFQHELINRKLVDKFLLLDMIPYDHISALMRTCQALINPSLFEGWSTTVEEARAMGTPMLLSDIAVHREQMGENATYFQRDSAESLALALKNMPKFDKTLRDNQFFHAEQDSKTRFRLFASNFRQLVVKANGVNQS
jgi:glycosyltransferase involved in cell wall biosynthesis